MTEKQSALLVNIAMSCRKYIKYCTYQRLLAHRCLVEIRYHKLIDGLTISTGGREVESRTISTHISKASTTTLLCPLAFYERFEVKIVFRCRIFHANSLLMSPFLLLLLCQPCLIRSSF